jgi:hypothetical protein
VRSYDEIHTELTREVEKLAYSIGTMYPQFEPEMLAHWILKDYKPPMDWGLKRDKSPFARTIHTVRILVAGRYFKYAAAITDEQASRDGRVVDEIKKRMRWIVGRQVMDWLSGEETEHEPVD